MRHHSLSATVRHSLAVAALPIPSSSRRVSLLSLSLCRDAIVKGSTCHRARSNRPSSIRIAHSVPSIMYPEPPQTCLLPDAPLEISPWFCTLRLDRHPIIPKITGASLTHGLSASRSHNGSIKGRGYNARELTEISRERLTSQARLEQLSMAILTPSCGGPRCGSIFLTTLHLSRDLKRWRWRFTRPRVVTRIHVEGSGLFHVMDRGPGAHSDGEGTFDSIVAHGVGRRTPLSQALMSSDLSFHILFMIQLVPNASANSSLPLFRSS